MESMYLCGYINQKKQVMINQKMHELEIFKDLVRNDMNNGYLSFETAREMFINIILGLKKIKNSADNSKNVNESKSNKQINRD